jgi:hypothetical protein
MNAADLLGPLDQILARLSRRSLLVDWEQVATIDGRDIHLNVPANVVTRPSPPPPADSSTAASRSVRNLLPRR